MPASPGAIRADHCANDAVRLRLTASYEAVDPAPGSQLAYPSGAQHIFPLAVPRLSSRFLRPSPWPITQLLGGHHGRSNPYSPHASSDQDRLQLLHVPSRPSPTATRRSLPAPAWSLATR